MPMDIILIAAGMALFYLLLIRPATRQAKAQATMQASLAEGTRVVLGSGLHGTILHLGQRQAIVELSPGVEVTVEKSAIVRVLNPDDEEFEYEDELPAAAPEPTDPDAVTDEPTVQPTSDTTTDTYRGQ